TFLSQNALREVTGMPILGSIGMNWTDQQKVARKRRLYAFGVAVASLFTAYGGGLALSPFRPAPAAQGVLVSLIVKTRPPHPPHPPPKRGARRAPPPCAPPRRTPGSPPRRLPPPPRPRPPRRWRKPLLPRPRPSAAPARWNWIWSACTKPGW